MELIRIQNLHKTYRSNRFFSGKHQEVHALKGIHLSIERGETLGLVGESGCGKSTLGRCIVSLIKPSEGEISFNGHPISGLSFSQFKVLRRQLQIIFQDPFSSLNPRLTVGDTLEEPLVIHRLHPTLKARMDRVRKLLDLVGLPHSSLHRFPHEFSGGQRQRIGIARALAVEPEFIVCDEPVSNLDVSNQSQILNLLLHLQKELRITYLFISHDLKVISHMSHRIAVMYKGEIMELGSRNDIVQNPQHLYTRALLDSIPALWKRKHEQNGEKIG